MWGEELESVEDVCHVFECYISGKKNKNGVKARMRERGGREEERGKETTLREM